MEERSKEGQEGERQSESEKVERLRLRQGERKITERLGEETVAPCSLFALKGAWPSGMSVLVK